jgi:hypothetical protein
MTESVKASIFFWNVVSFLGLVKEKRYLTLEYPRETGFLW